MGTLEPRLSFSIKLLLSCQDRAIDLPPNHVLSSLFLAFRYRHITSWHHVSCVVASLFVLFFRLFFYFVSPLVSKQFWRVFGLPWGHVKKQPPLPGIKYCLISRGTYHQYYFNTPSLNIAPSGSFLDFFLNCYTVYITPEQNQTLAACRVKCISPSHLPHIPDLCQR